MGNWLLSPCRLAGQYGYEFVAIGQDSYDGIRVLWGASRQKRAGPGARRFKVLLESEVNWREHVRGGDAFSLATRFLDRATGDLWTSLPRWRDVAVRRVDVAVDHWGYTWSADDLKRFVARQQVRGLKEAGAQREWKSDEERETPIVEVETVDGPTSATYYVGARNAASRYFRVYNKTQEARDKGKSRWMEPIWLHHGWDGQSTVWRAEIEHGGTWLSEHGLDNVEKLQGCEHALWMRYQQDVRHTVSRGRSRLKRRATSRVWRSIRAAIRRRAERVGLGAWEWKPRDARPDGDMEALSAMAAGCLRKIEQSMFRGDREGLRAFIDGAMAISEERALERQRSLAGAAARAKARVARAVANERPPPRRTA